MPPTSCKSTFVPVAQFVPFTDAVRTIFLKDKVNLLSVGIRYLPKNTESFLSYSQTDSFAFVLDLNQKMSDEGTRAAEQFTRELIEATLQYGGITFLTSDTRWEHRFERPIRSWTPSSRRKRCMTQRRF